MATTQKTNVLVYADAGVSQSCLLHLKTSLKALLSPRYDVLPVSAQALANDPWTDNCALLAFPGGRDLGFLKALGEKGCDRIARWVREDGGRYLGLCAGAYFASSQIEFESGREGFEVKGERPLKFFGGTCKGTAFPGFLYDSEDGARDAVISLEGALWKQVWPDSPPNLAIYYNGGGYFEEPSASEPPTTVLARYEELPDRPVAGVLCQIGSRGKAVLWGVHPEHPSVTPASTPTSPLNAKEPRLQLLRASLALLDLSLPNEERKITGITPHLLISEKPADSSRLAEELVGKFRADGSSCPILLADLSNNFRLYPQSKLQQVFEAASASNEGNLDVVVCSGSYPPSSVTPIFNFALFFETLAKARANLQFPFRAEFGSDMLYGEVVTSTQTVLERNPTFQSVLPSGFVFLGSHQIAGRGRGTNNWLSPPGCLQFSLVLRARKELGPQLVFVQYLFGLSVVEAVRNLPGYQDLELRLKWPNDLYVNMGADKGLRKVGGILVNSTYAGKDFTIIIGCGINTTNSSATAALCDLINEHNTTYGTDLPIVSQEELLALILPRFERMWAIFEQAGGFAPFAEQYTQRWLHSDKVVTIEESGQRVRIVGLAPDSGCLRTINIVSRSGSAQYIDLQPNGNSFDMMQGLLKAKK
ncbi:class II aaRS and biotin synthetase [Cystobasidium minutum MCA 4210]|uniref:class II aaRS and biotin synthetase n=1 Tax=Cystobasidium minutum MCA 4210 TaxID=1397322 RepID=UPI0034CE649D|eukprot:jgi/Rhomi1/106646/CE106645_615